MDVAQLVQKIRQEINTRGETLQNRQDARVLNELPADVKSAIAHGASVQNEFESFELSLVEGEPKPPQESIKNRLGAAVKGQLYRFLWWYGWGLKRLTDLTAHFVRVQHEGTTGLARHLQDVSQSAAESRRLINDLEQRQRALEAAQLKVQAQQIERNLQGVGAREVTSLTERLEALAADFAARLDHLQTQLAEVRERQPEQVADLARRVEAELGGQQQLRAELEEVRRSIQGVAEQRQQLAEQIASLGLYTHQTRAALSLQDRRLTFFIEEARKRLPQSLSPDQLQSIVTTQDSHKYDSVYVAFEDVFRGSRDEIKARQSIYLPYLREHGVGSESMPILDLGCGRGEWLELLRDNKLVAAGLDLNDIMIEQCRSLNLDVQQGDALTYLRSLPDSSKGAITSFHMVEHFPFDLTLSLVDEALRVLKPGGVLILETPNPQNILVGAHTFYLDPTHQKPLPSPMLRFFVEARGFCDAQVWELHPYPETVRLPENGNGAAKRINDHLYGPQDYAVVARKV